MRFWRNACVCLFAVAVAQPARAQRFEGVITMKLSGGNIAAVVGGRGGEGRGAAGRGAAARGGDATVAGGRGRGSDASTAAGRAGAARGGDARGGDVARSNDPQAEAMRSALAGGLQQIEYMTRRGRIRIGVVGASGAPSPAAMIYVPDEGVMIMLLPPISMYSETNIADLQATVPPASQGGGAVPPRAPTVTHTKQFELVAGHRCEHVIVTLGRQKTDICMGKGLGVFVMPAGIGRNEGWDRVMVDENGFPLKVTGSNGTVIMEVVKIERKALPESLFSVPDTYTKMPDILRRPPG